MSAVKNSKPPQSPEEEPKPNSRTEESRAAGMQRPAPLDRKGDAFCLETEEVGTLRRFCLNPKCQKPLNMHRRQDATTCNGACRIAAFRAKRKSAQHRSLRGQRKIPSAK